MNKVVKETLSGQPCNWPERVVERAERQLFQLPPPNVRMFLGAEFESLGVYTFPSTYTPVEFGPPRGIFEGAALRLEWQMMTGRQPFYHRNADVDEVGYQIHGQRSLITECGTVDFRRGQFSRIPVGVAHDNYCRDDIHLIFYMHGPTESCVTPVGFAKHKVPPFEGWEAKPTIEALTNAMGGPGGAIGYSMVEETLILDAACKSPEALDILEPMGPTGELEWVYRAPQVWIGHTRLQPSDERIYRRYLAADEIQYQVEGSRTIVSQRGVVVLHPGDFTMIPRGCSYANVANNESKHLSVLVTESTPPCKQPDRRADPDVMSWLAAHDGVQAEATR